MLRDYFRRNDTSPEEFLLKLERKEDCDAALKKGRIKVDDVSILFIFPWRMLSARRSFSVGARLPVRTGANRFDDRSVTMTDTHALGLWAWTTNPSALPKVV